LKANAGCRPILRWAGGKRRLVPRLMKLLPSHWDYYVEPMAGSAALFFLLAPPKAILADINSELMNFYGALRNDTDRLVTRLSSLRASKALYDSMRNGKPTSGLERAVRFAYLNRLCWNGLHRVNRNGFFNVPIGDRLPKRLWSAEGLSQAARLLQNARLLNDDFERTLRGIKRGSFVFIDPPYPRGARKGWFNRYSKDFFLFEDHQRLGRLTETLDERGISLMMIVGANPELLRCYSSSFVRTRLRSKSLISSKPSSRFSVEEVVLTNYDPRDRS